MEAPNDAAGGRAGAGSSSGASPPSLLQLPVRSVHEAAIVLLLHQLAHASVEAVRWLLPAGSPAADWNASQVSYGMTLVSGSGGAALRLLFVPLFDSLLVRPTLHLLPRATGPLVADSTALETAMKLSTPIDAPPLTIPDVRVLWNRAAKLQLDEAPTTPCTLASLSAEALAEAQKQVRALVFEPQAGRSHSFCGQLAALRTRAAQQSIDSQLFNNYIHRVIDGLHAAPSAADHSAIAVPASAHGDGCDSGGAAALSAAHPPVSLLSFSREGVVTTQSAFLALFHLLLAYEGFRPCKEGGSSEPSNATDVAASAAAAPEEPTLVHFMPAGWSSFTSSQCVYSLPYQHVSLVSMLPRHEVRFKMASLFGDTMLLHAQFIPDALAATAMADATDAETKETEGSMADAAAAAPTSSPPVPVAPIPGGKIYSISLRCGDFIPPSIVGHPPPSTSDPSVLFHNVGRLLSQYRNRVLKHMLGEEYRNAVNNDADAAQTSETHSSPSEVSGVMRLPSELLLAVLQLLPSRDVVAIGNTCWTLRYLSAHPLLWHQLCLGELPAADDDQQGASLKSDWKREYLIRLQEKEKGKEREKDARLRELLQRTRMGPFDPRWGPPLRPLRPDWGPGPGRPTLPNWYDSQPYHPFPFSVHPDSPYFLLPGFRGGMPPSMWA